MIAFSEKSPIALLYDKTLNEHATNDLVKFVLGEIWNHYTLPPILEQTKSVLFPPTQLIAGRFLDLPHINQEDVSKAVKDAVKIPWKCGAYCPTTRTMMDLSQWAGITFVPIDKNTANPSIGIVFIGQHKFGTTIRGKALLTLLLALSKCGGAHTGVPEPVKMVIALLQKQN